MFAKLKSKIPKISDLRELDWKYVAVRTASNILIFGALVYFASAFWEVGRQEILYAYWRFRRVEFTVDEIEEPRGEEPEKPVVGNPFTALLAKPTPLKVIPKSRKFGLVIEKIGVNAPVVADVDPRDKAEYMKALDKGVAHAKYTPKPAESAGNTYLFAHSALDFWNYGPYAGVFNLLRKLRKEDRIVVFYRQQRYDYEVISNEVVPGFDTKPLLRTFSTPHLTLQTCDPPGVALNRRIITAKLKHAD